MWKIDSTVRGKTDSSMNDCKKPITREWNHQIIITVNPKSSVEIQFP